MQEFTALRSDL